jgi:putative oxidoreductase
MAMMMSDAQREMLRSYGTLLGRILLGLLFFVSGLQTLFGEGGVAGLSDTVGGLGLPAAGLLAWIIVLVHILGGAGLILGYRIGLAAGALLVFTALTLVFVHNSFADPMLLKNLSIMGGLLYVMAYGAGEGWRLGK